MKTTVLKIAVHTDDSNPVFGENTYHVEIIDKAAGAYIRISEALCLEDFNEENGVDLDLEHLELIAEEARKLIEQYEKNGGNE
jgi:hypothetical protein